MADDAETYTNYKRKWEAANEELQAERARRIEELQAERAKCIKELQAERSRRIKELQAERWRRIKELQAERSRHSETEKRLLEALKFRDGLFYAKTSDLWKVDHRELVCDTWISFKREHVPDVIIRGSETVRPYLLTHEASLNDQKVAAGTESLRSESSFIAGNSQETDSDTNEYTDTMEDNAIWPCDFAGNSSPCDVQRAHLLPAGKVHHEQWCGIAAAVLGLPENVSDNVKLKATRGTKTHQDARRDAHTGVVHFITNKVLMQVGGSAWDGNQPKLILIPCLSLTDAKNWNGSAYSAIALAGCPTSTRIGGKPTVKYQCNASQVYRATGLAEGSLFHLRQCASADQFILAHELLQTTIMALADHVKNFPQAFTDAIARSSMMGRQSLVNSKAIPWPINMDPPNEEARSRVCLISFGSHGTREGHPAPDPLLLSMKAAVVWCYMTGFELIANGEKSDDDEEDDDDEFL